MTNHAYVDINDDVAPDPRKLAYLPQRADPTALERFVRDCFVHVGVPDADAALAAQILVDADLHGTDTHGIALLSTHYVQGIQAGAINPKAVVAVTAGSPTTVSVDGDQGLGMLVSHRAMSECLDRAEELGSGWATVYNSTHSAAGAYYVRMAAERGMIGFHWSTGGSTIAAPGGSGRLLGNNPFSFAAPGGSHGPFVLDMAPSNTIRPKIRSVGWRGEQMPEGWAVDGEGRPVTDPQHFFDVEGAILPLGGTALQGAYKGFGLLLLSDVMTGVLSGDGGSLLRRKGMHSHAFGALRVDAFPTGAEFGATMDAVVDALHEAPTLEGAEPVRFPGERAAAVFADRSVDGVPLRHFVVDELQLMADEFGLALDAIWRR